jgi:hypothetical protein
MRPHAACIVTGSLQGVLRVHAPHGRGYHPEDLLLETTLEAGILQLEAGRFAGCALGASCAAACRGCARPPCPRVEGVGCSACCTEQVG